MVKVAIMGHGTVGSGVYEVFQMNADKIARSLGEPVEVKYVLDLRDFSQLSYADKFVKDFAVLENDLRRAPSERVEPLTDIFGLRVDRPGRAKCQREHAPFR